MVGLVEETLRGKRFDDDAQFEQHVPNWILEHPASFRDEGIKMLPIRWFSYD